MTFSDTVPAGAMFATRDSMQALFPTDPPEYVGRVLHDYTGNKAIEDGPTEAGFTDAIYTLVEQAYDAASAWDVAVGYRLGTPLRSKIKSRAPGETERVFSMTAAALEKRFGAGPVKAGVRAPIGSAAG